MPAPDALAADLALLSTAAAEAGVIARRYFKRGVRVWDKGGGQGPVTEADLEVNAHLHATLAAARPGYGWLSEESDPLGDTARLDAETAFVIDPIDGTRAFIDDQPGFAHALAVVHRGKPVAAVVHLPILGLTYTAARGAGAWLNGAPIAVHPHDAPATAARVLAARPMFDAALWPGGMPLLERHFRPSLAWRLSLIGEGRFDAMLTLRDTWDWDIAAAALIAAEAGATVTDRHGVPLRFNTARAQNAGVIAASAPLHRRLLHGLAAPAALP